MEQLHKQMKGLTVGSVAHKQLREAARMEGRCFTCFSRQHPARECPYRTYAANAVRRPRPKQKYFEESSEADQDEEGNETDPMQDPEWVQ
jgi:hypothetical protein